MSETLALAFHAAHSADAAAPAKGLDVDKKYGPCATRLGNQPTPSARPWRYGHAASIEGAHWDIYAGEGIDGWLVGMVTTEADAALIVEAVSALAQPPTPGREYVDELLVGDPFGWYCLPCCRLRCSECRVQGRDTMCACKHLARHPAPADGLDVERLTEKIRDHYASGRHGQSDHACATAIAIEYTKGARSMTDPLAAHDIFDRLMELWGKPWDEVAFGEAQMLVARLRTVLTALKEPTPRATRCARAPSAAGRAG